MGAAVQSINVNVCPQTVYDDTHKHHTDGQGSIDGTIPRLRTTSQLSGS